MLKQLLTIVAIISCCHFLVQAQTRLAIAVLDPAQPDLQIRKYIFSPSSDKAMKVQVVNSGGAASGLCILRLTVRKINGVSVGRVTEVKLPPLAAGKDKWLVVDAKSILPNNISLESTTFKLNADATAIIAESNESNNEVWHNL